MEAEFSTQDQINEDVPKREYLILDIECELEDEDRLVLLDQIKELLIKNRALQGNIDVLSDNIKDKKTKIVSNLNDIKAKGEICEEGLITKGIKCFAEYDYKKDIRTWIDDNTGEVHKTESIPFDKKQQKIDLEDEPEKEPREITPQVLEEMFDFFLFQDENIQIPKGVTQKRLSKIKEAILSDIRFEEIVSEMTDDLTIEETQVKTQLFYTFGREILIEQGVIKP